MDYPIHIWTDLHLEHPLCDIAGIRRAQAGVEKDGGKVITAGDIVDLWYSSLGSISPESLDILRWLRERLIVMVPGNHDSLLVQYPISAGQRYPYAQTEIDGRLWYVEHGHLIGAWGWLFQLLDKYDDRTKFRKIARWLVKHDTFSHSGRRSADPTFKYEAINRCKLKGSTVAIIGHTHHAEIYRDLTGQTEVTYVNAGSALGKMTEAIYTNGDFKIRGA